MLGCTDMFFAGIPFPVQLENQHIVSASQVWCGVLGTGPDGTSLNSSFKSRSDPKYLAALGQVIIMILKIVPKGVLIFFPSYRQVSWVQYSCHYFLIILVC